MTATPETSGLSAKERFEAALALADFISRRVQDRRQYEWKITLGLWGLLAASPLYIRSKPPEGLLIAVLAGAVLAFALLFILPLSLEHRIDSDDMFKHYHQAEEIAGLTPKDRKLKELGPWWGWFQVATTAVLAVAAYYLIEVLPIAK